MKKMDRVTRLYVGLTNKEKAALAFGFLCHKNEIEWGRVEASVLWKKYKCVDVEYIRWRDRFFRMSSYWGIEHWQLRSRHTAAISYAMWAPSEEEHYEEMIEQLWKLESQLLALDSALEAVCHEHSLDIEAVRAFSGAEPFIMAMNPNAKPDESYQVEMQEALGRFVSRM